MSNSPYIMVAIDGPSASGKGTVAARVAAALGFEHLDSGALYRIVALAALGFAGQGKQALAIEAGVVLPQVVEHHLWPGLPVKHCPGRRRAEIA